MVDEKEDISANGKPVVKYIGETVTIQDINNFFKHFINPSLLEAKVEKATAAKLREARSVNMTIVLAVIMLMIGGGIAYMIISGSSTSATCQQELRSCYAGKAPVITAPLLPPTPTTTEGIIVK